MAKTEYIYRVGFSEPPIEEDDRTEFYFHSLTAIYEKFTPEQVGCKVTRLWNIGVSDGNEYTSRDGAVHISREPIERKHRTALCDD